MIELKINIDINKNINEAYCNFDHANRLEIGLFLLELERLRGIVLAKDIRINKPRISDGE